MARGRRCGRRDEVTEGVVTTTGVCRNPRCSKAAAAEIIERYPGPGEYCPECGEALDSALSPPPSESSESSDQGNRGLNEGMLSGLAPPRAPLFWRSRLFVASLAIALVAAVGFAFLRPMTIQRRPATGAIQVCRSSLTDRIAGDIVRTFAAKSRTPASRFALVSGGACDLRFAAGVARTDDDAVIGHDGIVVVVSRHNPVTELTLAQVRAILTGEITDWAQLGATKGKIVPMVPPDGSDEEQLLGATLLYDGKLGGAVLRSHSSAAIVRAVAGPSGRDRIGIVAFSAAIPVKVVKLPSLPPPSTHSIADHRYPFSLSVTVRRERPGRDPVVAHLLAYAQSDAAQALVVRDGLVAKEGF